MNLFPCSDCDDMVYSYEIAPLFPDENGEWTMETHWQHLHPSLGHEANPVLDKQ